MLLHYDSRREQTEILFNPPELTFDCVRCDTRGRVGNVENTGSLRGNRRPSILPIDDRTTDFVRISHDHVA